MALNQPSCNSSVLDDIIQCELEELVVKLNKEGFKFTVKDIDYKLLDRVEYIGLNSSVIYTNEDLPKMFGVYRGYSGGGIHSSLTRTEIHTMSKNRQIKAERILKYFEDCFWNILKSIDRASAEVEEVNSWDSVTL